MLMNTSNCEIFYLKEKLGVLKHDVTLSAVLKPLAPSDIERCLYSEGAYFITGPWLDYFHWV